MLSVQGLEHIKSTKQVVIGIHYYKSWIFQKALNFNKLPLFANYLLKFSCESLAYQ